jgi:hypothetical protein
MRNVLDPAKSHTHPHAGDKVISLILTVLLVLGFARPAAAARQSAPAMNHGLHSVSGAVRADGIGLQGGVVSVYQSSTLITSTVTGAGGAYTVRMPAGTYTMSVQLPGYAMSAPVQVTISSSGFSNFNITLTKLYYDVRGSVLQDGVLGLPGVTVTAVQTTTPLTSTTSIAGGDFALRLPVGVFTLTAALPGYAFAAPITVSVTTTDVTGVQINATRLFYTVSGVVTSGGSVLPGVQLSCDGKSAVTNATGVYTITGLVYGACVLAPTLTGYTFVPPFVPLSVTGNIDGQNFVATPIPLFAIGGRILDAQSGEAAPNVQVTDGARTTYTDPAGFYELIGVPAGTYLVSAAKSGYRLSDARTVVITNTDVSGVNFTAMQNVPVHDVSGEVKPYSMSLSSQCVGGVQVLYGIGSAVTQTEGKFDLLGLPPGTYAVTPFKAGCAFAPVTQIITITNTSLSGLVFTEDREENLYSISGRATSSGQGLAGARVSYGAGVVTTDAQGYFSIANLQPGSYTLTPVLFGYRFEPASTVIAIQNSDVVIASLTGVPLGSRVAIPTVQQDWPKRVCVTPGADCGLEPDNAVRPGANVLPSNNATYYATIGGTADVRDVYGFDLTGGVRYRFAVTHAAIGDLNIYLYDATTSTPLVSSAMRGTANESITFTPPADGRYFLQVVAASVRVKSTYQFSVAF